LVAAALAEGVHFADVVLNILSRHRDPAGIVVIAHTDSRRRWLYDRPIAAEKLHLFIKIGKLPKYLPRM
jgi:hypothetical protein